MEADFLGIKLEDKIADLVSEKDLTPHLRNPRKGNPPTSRSWNPVMMQETVSKLTKSTT